MRQRENRSGKGLVGEEVVEFAASVGEVLGLAMISLIWGVVGSLPSGINASGRRGNYFASSITSTVRKGVFSHNELAEPIEAVLVASTFNNTAHE